MIADLGSTVYLAKNERIMLVEPSTETGFRSVSKGDWM